MPPLIVSNEHDKKILSIEDFFLDIESNIILETRYRVLPAFDFQISVVNSSKSSEGLVVVTSMNDGALVGNIIFELHSRAYRHILELPVAQIRSVIIKPEFRGFGIATRAYDLLCEIFAVASDCIQTCDGAALWHYSIPKLDSIDINLIANATTEPYLIKANLENDDPMQIEENVFEFDHVIWSAENLTAHAHAVETGIHCSMGIHCRDVILIAIPKRRYAH